MRRDGAARLRDEHLAARNGLLNLLHERVERLLRHAAGVRDEHMLRQDVLALEPLGDVLAVDLVDRAAVFLADDEFALLHLQAGLELEQVRAQRRHARAAPALPHVLERVEHEARVHALRHLAQRRGNRGRILAGITQLRALQREQPAARGEMAAVDDVDAPFFQLTRRETGVLIGAREVRADVDVDDVHPLGEDREEEVEELLRADGRGLRERSAAAERLVEVLGGVAPVVEEGLLPLNDRQRDHADLKPLQKRRREVAGAVIGNTNRSCHG